MSPLLSRTRGCCKSFTFPIPQFMAQPSMAKSIALQGCPDSVNDSGRYEPDLPEDRHS
jgi:hypothetical protein